ncbi:MAG: YdcH family protein [Rhizobacter sp.]
MNSNLHSLPRLLIELRIEHGDLDGLIDQASLGLPEDELMLRRLKKRRLVLKDQISRIEAELDPPQPA